MRYATTKVGKRGVVIIPAPMRKHLGLEVGATVIAEERDDGVLLRPAVTLPVEVYTDARKAEFLLNNALSGEDYARALKEVKALGIDPDSIPHQKPKASRKKGLGF
jgi:AbrB family looped-hinge helix DNA binding protein